MRTTEQYSITLPRKMAKIVEEKVASGDLRLGQRGGARGRAFAGRTRRRFGKMAAHGSAGQARNIWRHILKRASRCIKPLRK